jgi:N-acetylneuraminic acid mutarotase
LAQSDVPVTASDGTAYIVGGYDGNAWLTTILAWRPGEAAKVVRQLPVGLRYAAASGVDGQVIIAGGSTPAGASDAVLRFDPVTGRVSQIGRLPAPTTHAAAATLDGFVYVVGGRGDDVSSQRPGVLSIDPRTGRVRPAGRLPMALSDAAVLPVGGGLLIAGGLSPSGTESAVGELTPAPSPGPVSAPRGCSSRRRRDQPESVDGEPASRPQTAGEARVAPSGRAGRRPAGVAIGGPTANGTHRTHG